MKSARFWAAMCVSLVLACSAMGGARNVGKRKTVRPHQGAGPEEVSFFIYIIDIDDISGQEQSFHINFHLSLRWKDESLAHGDSVPHVVPMEEVWNPGVILLNRQALLRTPLPETIEVDGEGNVTYRQQYVGPMSEPLDLRDFPLDTQSFAIHFVGTGSGTEEVTFVPRAVPDTDFVGGTMADTFSLPDWQVLEHHSESRPLVIGPVRVPGFAFVFTAKRYFSYYVWQVMLPLVLIVMMSWAPFWVNPAKAGLQLGLASSTVLTLIAYRFLLANLIPKLPYLTRLDYLTLSGTVLVFAAFMQVLVTSVFALDERRARLAHIMDDISRALFPIIFILLTLWSLAW